MSNKTSDKNVANIEDDVEILESIVKVHNDFLQGVNKESINEKEIRALEHLLSHYKNMKFNYENLIHDISLIAESLGMQEDSTIEEIAIRISEEMYNQQQINEEHKRINGELRERVKELEEIVNCCNIVKNATLSNDIVVMLKSDFIRNYEQIYIPKQVVIDRIKELKLSGGSNGKDNVENLVRELAIDILQELLGGEK